MDAFYDFLNMGGYAVWVWTSYGISAAALVGLLLWSLRSLWAREKEFAALKNAREPQS